MGDNGAMRGKTSTEENREDKNARTSQSRSTFVGRDWAGKDRLRLFGSVKIAMIKRLSGGLLDL